MTDQPQERQTAPIQLPREYDRSAEAARIPWELHERAAAQYNKLGYNQSAERLAERGGFGLFELAVLLAGGDPFDGKDPWRPR